MSAERDEGGVLFDVNGVYSKQEFLWRMEVIKSRLGENHPLMKFFNSRIPWAERLPEGVKITFWTDEMGVVRPRAFFDQREDEC